MSLRGAVLILSLLPDVKTNGSLLQYRRLTRRQMTLRSRRGLYPLQSPNPSLLLLLSRPDLRLRLLSMERRGSSHKLPRRRLRSREPSPQRRTEGMLITRPWLIDPANDRPDLRQARVSFRTQLRHAANASALSEFCSSLVYMLCSSMLSRRDDEYYDVVDPDTKLVVDVRTLTVEQQSVSRSLSIP